MANTRSFTQWQQAVTHDLTRIKLVQEQQSTLLTQIWQTLQVQNVQALQRPSDVPEFPIERKGDFGVLEEWLENQQNFNYMVSSNNFEIGFYLNYHLFRGPDWHPLEDPQ